MAWTTPKTDWTIDDLVAASDMNAIGENLAALKNPSAAAYATAADMSISNSSAFADIDSSFNLTIDTAGGDVLVHFHGTVTHSGLRLDVDVDGTRQGDADYGIRRGGLNHELVSFSRLIQNLSPGTHTFKLQARNSSATLRAGAQFWVREL